MKDKKLLFDRKCHVLYSRPCKEEIQAKIALHYPETEREAVWEKVQRQYADFLSDWRTDIVSGSGICQAVRIYGHHARPVQCGLCVHGAAPRKTGADDYLCGRLPM